MGVLSPTLQGPPTAGSGAFLSDLLYNLSSMWEVVTKIIFLAFVLPIIIVQEAWAMFTDFMARGNRWQYVDDNWLSFVLAILVLLLVILILMGYV